MSISEKLQSLLVQQKEITRSYEEMLSQISYDQMINENELLKSKVKTYEKSLEDLRIQNRKLEEERLKLKRAYNQQIIDERNNLLYNSKSKTQLYFQDKAGINSNKLSRLEYYAKENIDKLSGLVNREIEEDKQVFEEDINRMYEKLDQCIKDRRHQLSQREENINAHINDNHSDMAEEEISEALLKKKEKHNDIEIKIGLNLLNKIGIIIILIGVITAVRYTYATWFNDYVKGISIYLLGFIFIVGGEVFSKKDKRIFSLGLSGGGIGVLYIATFVSYFTYNIISLVPSMFLAVIITVAALILSLRYESKTICGLSLIGGYLPFFSYFLTSGIEGNAVFVSMMYLLLLNVFVLIISFKKRWIFINYLSFVLNIPSVILLINLSQNDTISIAYTLIIFLLYVAISLAYPLIHGTKLTIIDVILLGLNTIIKSVILFELFNEDYRGLVAFLFVITYFILAEIVKRKTSGEKKTQALFYVTALTFAVLMIPFQFGIKWYSLGWLIEGVVLIYVARRIKERGFEIAGWIIWGLSFFAFGIDTVLFNDYYYDLKYTINTLAMIFILSMYIKDFDQLAFRHSIKGVALILFKYVVLIYTWLFLIYQAFNGINFIRQNEAFFYMVVFGLLTMLYGYGISKIKVLGDQGIKIFVTVLYFFGDLIAFSIIFYPLSGSIGTKLLGVAIIIVYNILVVFNIRDLFMKLIKGNKLGYQIYPPLLGLYILASSVGFISSQLDLGRLNLLTSICIILLALIYLIVGFRKNFLHLRRFGLGLALFALTKLFIFDLSYLDLLGKIIAYFSFGLILIIMSFVYQKIKNQIER